ncbi:hypothetical protein RHGRI_037555 [Rhododendron griersonianum]|uniref:PSP proline-rich domain-containing protein n=1 Tax=Rhododendron griersonianum TaxID=479676 RepID=A0AAV6HUY9_9ERIC|nr:hypothetical protein RHGRI_037555 [Rhododendron griersonianum]
MIVAIAQFRLDAWMFCYLPGVVRFGFHSQEKRRAGVLGVEEVKKFGDLEVKPREMKPGMLSQELKEALGMPEGAPPPWLINMQVEFYL